MRRAVLTLVVVAAVGCGSSERDKAGAVVKSYLLAVAERDAERACEALPPMKFVDGQSCEEVMERGFASQEPFGDETERQARTAEITFVEINGNRARVGTDVMTEPATLVRIDDQWYVDLDE